MDLEHLGILLQGVAQQIQGAQILATAAAIHFLPSLSFQLSCAYISNG
jgi:hypothetical protein